MNIPMISIPCVHSMSSSEVAIAVAPMVAAVDALESEMEGNGHASSRVMLSVPNSVLVEMLVAGVRETENIVADAELDDELDSLLD